MNPITITMTIDRSTYHLTESQEPSLIFTAISQMEKPITIYLKGSVLDPDRGNVWKKSKVHQLFEAVDVASGRHIYFPTEIRCGPPYIRSKDFKTLQPGIPLRVEQPLRMLSNWTRRTQSLSFTDRNGQELDRYFQPGHKYEFRLRLDPQISMRWWDGTAEELLSQIGPTSRLRDLPVEVTRARIDGIPGVTVMIEE